MEESSPIPGSDRPYMGVGVGGGGSGLASPQVLHLLLRDGQLLPGPADLLSSPALLRARLIPAPSSSCHVRGEASDSTGLFLDSASRVFS